MADNQTPAAGAKRRKPQGPRTPKPIFAVVSYTDDQGQSVRLDKQRLQIRLERDSAKLVELLTDDAGSFGNAAVVRVELPQGQPRAKAEGGAGASS